MINIYLEKHMLLTNSYYYKKIPDITYIVLFIMIINKEQQYK